MTRISDLPDLATPSEVAQVLKCSTSYVQNECKAGRIACSLVAGRFLISPEAVKQYLKGQRVPCPEKIKAHTFSGEEKGRSGKFDGLSTEGNARNQRALKTAEKLKELSRHSSSEQNPSGQVIQLGV